MIRCGLFKAFLRSVSLAQEISSNDIPHNCIEALAHIFKALEILNLESPIELVTEYLHAVAIEPYLYSARQSDSCRVDLTPLPCYLVHNPS